MLKRIGWVAYLTLAAALTLSACGGNDTVTTKPGPDVDVRNGTWSLGFDASFSGPDSCADLPDTSFAFPDTILCSFDLVGTGGYAFDCTSSIEGETVVFECTALLRDLDPCQIIGHIEGTGTVTDTTIELNVSVYEELTGPGEVCDLYQGLASVCTEDLHITGEWLSAERADECPDADTNKASVVRALLNRAAAARFDAD